MDNVGPGGFYLFTAVLFAALVVYAIYRSTQRAAVPVDETGSFVAMSPAGTTVVGMEIAQEWAIESAEAAQDDTDGSEAA